MTAPAKPARLDRDARREVILDVAQGVFLEDGFAAASMSTIAARLGGSKGTLYNYFKSKDELFEDVVRRHCFWRQEALFGDLDPGLGAETTLLRLAATYIRITLNEETMRSLRLVIAEVERSPQIGRSFYEEGPKFGADRLATMMADWMGSGDLEADDPLEAAEFFLGLCKGRFYMPRLLNYSPELTPAQAMAAAEKSVRAFLKIYAKAG
ncbi:TetR/AcrR family transcriptional regulator [Phenylobacterium immobile]|uniref:TetR/AcrR family transcriptional regulator n=1 Tax=Phenylobacterium immobile TaxID=21 RepID=UPI000B25372B|nr:TetR/AcrR family transcriptional regulator [Phenylobacterium immobile]